MKSKMVLPAAKAAVKPATVRSMFIRVKPVPRQLSERRAVLRTLQKYGEIEVFQRLMVKGYLPTYPVVMDMFSLLTTYQEPGSFISVASSASTVNNLIENAPLRFDLVPDRPSSSRLSTTTEGTAPRDIYALDRSTAPTLTNNPDSFILSIFPADMQHRVHITKSPLYGPWPIEDAAYGSVKTFASSVLEDTVPKDITAKGMVDWDTGGQMVKLTDRPRVSPVSEKERFLAGVWEEREARRREKKNLEKNMAGGGAAAGVLGRFKVAE